MERPIDFSRDRHMLCGGCGQRFLVDLDWIDRWEQGQEKCPGCGMTCENEDAPRVTVDPADPALDDDRVTRLFWYHTSTQPDWPTQNFDPAARLTADTRLMMGGDRRVAAWAERQRAKAPHVGTYEAAIHNMLRRINDQTDHGSQFYLYRVRLQPTTAVREGWVIDPSDFVGDVMLHEVCPPEVDAARYLNYHEDPGGLSLALGRDAIASVQRIPIPAPDACDIGWVRDAVVALSDATEGAAPPADALSGFQRFQPSPQALAGRELAEGLATRLPINLQWQFTSAAAFVDGADPARWARRTSGLIDAIENPAHVLALLDGQECRSFERGHPLDILRSPGSRLFEPTTNYFRHSNTRRYQLRVRPADSVRHSDDPGTGTDSLGRASKREFSDHRPCRTNVCCGEICALCGAEVGAWDPGDPAGPVADAAQPLAVVADPDVELAVGPLGALDRLRRVHLPDGVGRPGAVRVVLDVEVAGYPVCLRLVVDVCCPPPVDRAVPDAESVRSVVGRPHREPPKQGSRFAPYRTHVPLSLRNDVFHVADGRVSWTVLDEQYAIVGPVDRFLAHLSAVDRSPQTVRSYAFDLRDLFAFLLQSEVAWDAVRLEDLGRFVAWLGRSPAERAGNVSRLSQAHSHCSPSTINRKLAAVVVL